MFKYLVNLLIVVVFVGCSYKQPKLSKSSVILFKTPTMKFYDKGFINYFHDHIHLQIFEVGQVVLDLSIYKEKICKSALECTSSTAFNAQYLHSSYKEDFLYNLFSQENIYHKDKTHGILIKVK